MKMCLYTLLCSAVLFACSQRPVQPIQPRAVEFNSIEEALASLPYEFTKNTESIYIDYEGFISQPVNHGDRLSEKFDQLVTITHKGFDKPTIIHTNGYSLTRRPPELAAILDANVINVEHRYFGSSIPENADWQHLNLKNATADLHAIKEMFDNIYPGKWISTGVSKGGQTSLMYKYFYPNDVDLSVPYVAPLNRGLKDERIYQFLSEVGSEECRSDITELQHRLLRQYDLVVEALEGGYTQYSFELIGGIERAFEFAVLEYPFSFWQSGKSCDDIPYRTDGFAKDLFHFVDAVGLGLYTDESMEYYGPHYYQAGTEMGYYGFETEEFNDELRHLSGEPSAVFMPDGLELNYDNSLNEKVNQWVNSDADDMIFIYGGIDTWTATGAEVSENNKVLKIVLDERSHSDANIANMTEEQRDRFNNYVAKALDLPEFGK